MKPQVRPSVSDMESVFQNRFQQSQGACRQRQPVAADRNGSFPLQTQDQTVGSGQSLYPFGRTGILPETGNKIALPVRILVVHSDNLKSFLDFFLFHISFFML